MILEAWDSTSKNVVVRRDYQMVLFCFVSKRDEIGSVLILKLSAQRLAFPEGTARRP